MDVILWVLVFLGVGMLVSIISFLGTLNRLAAEHAQREKEVDLLIARLKDEPGVKIELGGSEIANIIAKKMGVKG